MAQALEHSECLVEVRGVDLNFGGLQALRDASLTVNMGEIHALIGPNGAGKSTLVNCISGYQKMTGGRISVVGRSIANLSPSAIARSGVARTFQTPQLFGRLTVMGNILVALRPHGQSTSIGELIRQLGLGPRETTLAADLSYGEQRLLEVARALACAPTLLLVDEPAAGLPAEDQVRLEAVLRDFVRRGNGVLLIEHNVGMVRRVSDRISVLHQGAVIASGDPKEVLADPHVVAAYLGSSDRRLDL
jgi:ABC-type branched-subunit amino acid transport system ATPase component